MSTVGGEEFRDVLRSGMIGAQVSMPTAMLSWVPIFAKSTPEQQHPIRDATILGLDDFFDHAGNFVDGHLATLITLAAGTTVIRLLDDHLDVIVDEKREVPVILALSAGAGAVSVGVNVAYEAGVHIPPFSQKPPEAPFDAAVAAYGGINGLLGALGFCVAALVTRRKIRKQSRDYLL